MSNKIHLAWAVPVDPTMMAASLMAYATTKATITTFRLCARSSQQRSGPLGLLPPEILLNVEDYVLSLSGAEELQKWALRFCCLADACIPEEHLTDEQEDNLRQEALDLFAPMDLDLDFDSDEFCEKFEEYFTEFLLDGCDEWRRAHEDIAEQLHHDLTNSHSRLSKSKAFFAKSIGLKVHFDVFPEYMEEIECPMLLNARVAAFLMLPRYECVMDNFIGPNEGGFSIMKKINPLHFRPLCDSERSLFDRSLRMLKLKATDFYMRKDVASSDTKDKASALECVETESLKKPESEQQLVDNTEEWPALMFLGSGSLESFPTH